MKYIKPYLKAFGAGVCFIAYSIPIFAQTDESILVALNSLDWKEGPTTAKVGHVARQEVDSGYKFLEAADARKFKELGRNPSSSSDVGVIVSGNWWACYSYDDIGYVSDDEKGSLDSEAILTSLKEGTKEGNAERRRRGWPELTILGWAQEPHYDESTHNLEWATKISSSDSDGICVNYNTRILGREGVMSVTLVCEPDELSSALPEFKHALRGFSYNAGKRYAEYRKGDRAAEIGLSALILGGAGAAAAKTGAFKWLWKGIVVVVIAIGGFLKKIFGGGRKEQ